MPEKATEWVRELMTVLLKYKDVVGLGELARDLLQFSKDLRHLRELLADRARTVFVAVTRAAELPRLETVRLAKALDALEIPRGATIVNALTEGDCARCRRIAKVEAREV